MTSRDRVSRDRIVRYSTRQLEAISADLTRYLAGRHAVRPGRIARAALDDIAVELDRRRVHAR